MAKENGKLTAVSLASRNVGKHFDGDGLFLHVTPTGARYWRLKYRFAGKEKLLALGVFPEVSLAEARKRKADARAQLRDGTDPNAAKVAAVVQHKREHGALFPAVAADWLEFKRQGWSKETHRKAKYVVDDYLAPPLRKQSVATLTTKQAAETLLAVAAKAPALAVKARGYLSSVIAFAILHGLRDDGRLLAMRGVLPRVDKGHIAAATDPATICKVARAVEAYPTAVTRAALKVAMLTAQRPGNVAAMEWSEVNLDAAEWHIPAAKMKKGHNHIVPLSKQAVATIREMLPFTAGKLHVFPPLARQKNAHLHRDSLSKALREMGFQDKHATQGFRGMFRTVARERMGIAADVLEAQLAHAKRGDVAKAYDRTQFLTEREAAMQEWANYIDALKNEEGTVVPFKHKAA